MFRSILSRIASIDLDSSRALGTACVLAPIFFGLCSLRLGQDSNWDLLNYHWYNAFSFLNGKIALDLAPAGMQTYFNPLLDLPYYLMASAWPAPFAGFAMGFIHGLNFALVLGIARQALPDLPDGERRRIPLLLAIAGCLTGNFLSEIGNTMGDNTTALFVLASLSVVLSNWKQFPVWSPKTALIAVLAGSMAGLGAGLKLTNAIYAVALAASFLVLPLTLTARLRLSLLFGFGVMTGLALTAGHWFVEMWQLFGNPLFPQFSQQFPNVLARPIAVADTRFLPKNWLEALLWPFVFAYDSQRISEIRLPQIIWPMLYSLFWVVCFHRLSTRLRGITWQAPRGPALYLLSVVAIAYPLWVVLFSIYRYVVPMELLAPTAIFISLRMLLPYQKACRTAKWMISACIAVVMLSGVPTWEHVGWDRQAFRVEVPVLSSPSTTTVLLVGGDPPQAFYIPSFPPQLAFAQIGGSFPEAPGYAARIRSMAATRAGPTYALITAYTDHKYTDHVNKINRIAERFGLGCEALRWISGHFRLHAILQEIHTTDSTVHCKFSTKPEDDVDLTAKNHAEFDYASKVLVSYGFQIEPGTCATYRAFFGDKLRPYQLCKIRQLDR